MSDFLYPFLDERERDAGTLLRDLSESAAAKAETSAALRSATLDRLDLRAVAAAMAERFAGGGRLFTFGNGGSSTDAAAMADLFADPPRGIGLPARSLAADEAVLTALANDIGFDVVFARQLIAHARPTDIAVGLSTSGSSENVLAALAQGRRQRLLTIGLAGYDGGTMATSGDIDHCLVVASDSVHRIQETQAAVGYRLWELVQERVAP